MTDRRQCPECDSFNTERVQIGWRTDLVEEIRICNECPTQFTNSFDLFQQSVDDVPMEADSA
jgi:hypothetical protein